MFGHGAVSVLDGGLGHWKAWQHPVETGIPQIPTPQHYVATYNPHLVKTLNQVQECLRAGSSQVKSFASSMHAFLSHHKQVVDARSEGRFKGTVAEPRPSFPSGHMIGAMNVPFMDLINSETKLMKSKEEIRNGTFAMCTCGMLLVQVVLLSVFKNAGVDLSAPILSTCGSGITAAILTFAAHLINKEMPLYDVTSVLKRYVY